jgi:hypothetical protein
MMLRALLMVILIACIAGCALPQGREASLPPEAGADVIKLPPPALSGNTSVEEALNG